jgi:hypothetical protein
MADNPLIIFFPEKIKELIKLCGIDATLREVAVAFIRPLINERAK